MDRLTQAYSHLEYKNKIQAAGSVTWMNKLSIADPISHGEGEISDQYDDIDLLPSQAKGSSQTIPDFVHNLLAMGVPQETIEKCLGDETFDWCSLSEKFSA